MSTDAIVLLKNDHKEVRKVFVDFEKAGETAYVTKGELVDQIIERARRIVGVPIHAAEPGMENSDVEKALDRLWICRDQVFRHRALLETLAVQCDAVTFEQNRFSPFGGERFYVARQG